MAVIAYVVAGLLLPLVFASGVGAQTPTEPADSAAPVQELVSPGREVRFWADSSAAARRGVLVRWDADTMLVSQQSGLTTVPIAALTRLQSREFQDARELMLRGAAVGLGAGMAVAALASRGEANPFLGTIEKTTLYGLPIAALFGLLWPSVMGSDWEEVRLPNQRSTARD